MLRVLLFFAFLLRNLRILILCVAINPLFCILCASRILILHRDLSALTAIFALHSFIFCVAIYLLCL